MQQMAKGDIDRVIEAHHRELFDTLKLVTEKLYRRNPREWRKTGLPSMEAAVARLFDQEHGWRLHEFEDKRGIEVLQMAFRAEFGGDRVGALMGGLAGMIQTAFRDHAEFFIIDELDPQALSNAARNVEIAVWKLSQARDESGAPLLLSNEISSDGTVRNLSFEREFGKLIGGLDMSARIVADKNNRVVTRILQTLATAVFLPVK